MFLDAQRRVGAPRYVVRKERYLPPHDGRAAASLRFCQTPTHPKVPSACSPRPTLTHAFRRVLGISPRQKRTIMAHQHFASCIARVMHTKLPAIATRSSLWESWTSMRCQGSWHGRLCRRVPSHIPDGAASVIRGHSEQNFRQTAGLSYGGKVHSDIDPLRKARQDTEDCRACTVSRSSGHRSGRSTTTDATTRTRKWTSTTAITITALPGTRM